MTEDEAMRHIRHFTPLAQVMAVLSGEMGRVEQASMQRRPASPVEIRKMQLEGVGRILSKAEEVGLVTRN